MIRRGTIWFSIAMFLMALSSAAQTPETRAYENAVRAYDDTAYELAEKDFAQFLQMYPNSPRVPDAILYRARAALRRQQAKVAIDLLTTNAVRAGTLADQYRYSLAEAHMENTNHQAAADTFARVVREFPASPLLLAASYGEALARFKLRQWLQVVDLLRNPTNTFQTQARQRTNDEFVVRGELLLAEALLESGATKDAEATIRASSNRQLSPEYRWRSQYLLCRAQLADGHAGDALVSTTNLIALAQAGGAGQKQFLAESHALQAGIFERLEDRTNAVASYSQNLTENTPPEYRRQALLRTIELTLEQNKLVEAAQRLENFFTQYAEDAASEVALLTVGELHLKRHLASLSAGTTNSTASSTNDLHLALAHFDRLLTNYPTSSLIGKAHLNRGWCFWFDGRVPDAQLAFRAAADRLPPSEEDAVAHFKLGDTEFQLRNLTNAIASYRIVVDNYQRSLRVRRELASHALYQILRASLELNDRASASTAVHQLVREDHPGSFAQRGVLLLGQNLTQVDKPSEARALFEAFLTESPDSPLRPEIELAIARTHVYERNWDAAVGIYESWRARYGTNELRPRAEFSYAYVNYHAGRLTNALTLLTNFLARFPNNTNAPRAKYWVAAYYYDQKEFVNAEYHFQGLYETWPSSDLRHIARLMAGRSAFARQEYRSALTNFLAMLNDTACPPDLVAEGLFALGDTYVSQEVTGGDPSKKFDDAITAFRKIVTLPQLPPTHRQIPLAWGRIGDCCFELAAHDPNFYSEATNAYNRVLQSPNADVTARSQAEFGLGKVMERLSRLAPAAASSVEHLWKVAFEHYYNVVRGKNTSDETDPYWVKEAGLAAARLAEEHQEWEMATRIYMRLSEMLPPLRNALKARLDKAREQLRADASDIGSPP